MSQNQAQRNPPRDEDDTETENEDDDLRPAAEGPPIEAALDIELARNAVAVAAAIHRRHVAPGERPREPQLYPSPEELGAAPNPRAADALCTWYTRLRELVNFKRDHDHVNVPQTYPPNRSLGIWVNKQRCSRSSLSDEKLDALDAIGFDWGRKKGDAGWHEKLEELIVYRATKGNCLVPTKYPKNPSLGRWVSTQRAEYRKFVNGIKTTMTAARVTQLNDIGFVWNVID